MGARFVKFGSTHVNPLRVLSSRTCTCWQSFHMGTSAPIRTGLPTAQVIKMLEDALGE